MRVSLSVLLITAASVLVAAVPANASTRGLDVGFLDGLFASPDPAQRAASLDEARESGASLVRFHVFWRAVAPSRPIAPRDPADPSYHWERVAAGVRDAQARGLTVLLTITNAPDWAEGAGRPRSVTPGTWRPDPAALRDFAIAAARRFPTVTRWQIWNEPNLNAHLTPQWERHRGRLRSAAAPRYRRMLNSAYSGLKSVNRRIRVLVGGTAPYGDPPGLSRTRPLTFWKNVFKRRTYFDIFAHHPYSVASPHRHALNRADISVPDVSRLTRLVRTAVRHGSVRPRKSKPLWITELGWDSNPPDPDGVPAARQAAWLGDAFYVLWRQHAARIVWTFVRDQAPIGGYDVTYQSGVFTYNGTPKLAQQAIAFPIACERISHGRGLRVWAKSPTAGRVRLIRGSRTVKRLTVGQRRVFLTRVSGRRGLRATVAGRTSLQCRPT
jgi:hypothetical protein